MMGPSRFAGECCKFAPRLKRFAIRYLVGYNVICFALYLCMFGISLGYGLFAGFAGLFGWCCCFMLQAIIASAILLVLVCGFGWIDLYFAIVIA